MNNAEPLRGCSFLHRHRWRTIPTSHPAKRGTGMFERGRWHSGTTDRGSLHWLVALLPRLQEARIPDSVDGTESPNVPRTCTSTSTVTSPPRILVQRCQVISCPSRRIIHSSGKGDTPGRRITEARHNHSVVLSTQHWYADTRSKTHRHPPTIGHHAPNPRQEQAF